MKFLDTVASVRFMMRRITLVIACRFANRQFAFAMATVAILGAKVVHIYAHLSALPTTDVLLWGLSFFAQDASFLLVLRVLLDGRLFATVRWFRIVATTVASAIVTLVLLLATINISFLAVTRTELHWRNIGVAGDPSSWKALRTGLPSSALVLAALIVVAGVLQVPCYVVAGTALNILKYPVMFLFSRIPTRRWHVPLKPEYEHLPQHDVAGELEHSLKDGDYLHRGSQDLPSASSKLIALYMLVGVVMMALVVSTIVRPAESPLIFMSWTLPLVPFIEVTHSLPTLAGTGINGSWDNLTALAEPIPFPWLPKDTPLFGFEDWYESGKEHYLAASDPLKISNLEDKLLPELRNRLADVTIRHVMLVILEATRKDVFPIKKEGIIWERLANSFANNSLPEEAQERLTTLSSTANFLTGDYDDGFEHAERKRRGGINVNDAHTTSTYTLKSLVGTLCGLSPLVAESNVEHENHVYQPCLPHIFEALNQLDHSKDEANEDDFTSFKWKSTFMQSVTDSFDHQDHLMAVLGYAKENLVTSEYLRGDSAKFGPTNQTDINYFGMPEVVLEDYIRDAFASAKENNERVFLSHLTSTTHHEFSLPETEKYVSLTDDENIDDLSRYVNAVGYVDRWLGNILDILDAEGVADETLLILVGDHGLSIAECGNLWPYLNPNIGNFHVPLVLSHPKLPPIDVNDAVVSLQILPTILDLLLETGSLSNSESEAARALVRSYEGQSLLRPLRKFSGQTGQGNWQYTVINPGGAMLSVRDARYPKWRLIFPLADDTEWRFTDLSSDPHEEKQTLSFDFPSFLRCVEGERGNEAARWAEEAAFVTGWWVEENNKRWRYEL
jgi:hypothetical protein